MGLGPPLEMAQIGGLDLEGRAAGETVAIDAEILRFPVRSLAGLRIEPSVTGSWT